MGSRNNVVRTVKALRKQVAAWKKEGLKVALVPTMGALHAGHLSLVKQAQKKADRVVVSIFVNPSQFGVNEDLSQYPRPEQQDRDKLDAEGTDLVYIPAVEEIYPAGFSTAVTVNGLTDCLCGKSRPTHFSGVSTVVTKLLLQVMPDIAIFGEKDYQQLLVIRRCTADLDIPVKISGGAIVREKDGLAMSSRNAYLTPEEREIAPALYQTLREFATAIAAGEKIPACLTKAEKKLIKNGFRIDYLELRNAETLEPVTGKSSCKARLFAAVFLGRTRLIDNIGITISAGGK